MLKVALINPPQFTKYAQPPMGLATIAAVLEKAGYRANIIDANALHIDNDDLINSLIDTDIVCLSAMTPTVNTAIGIARDIKKKRPDLPIVLGGAHATLLPEQTLASAPDIDVIVRSEGEKIVLDLLPVIKAKQSLKNIAGITYRNDGKITTNPAPTGEVDLDSLPFLAYHLLPWREYRPHPPHGRALPFAAIITSRGCPYHCAYCSKPIFGNKFRAQSAERVIGEIGYFKEKFGIRELAFYDDVFTLNKKRAYAIADEMIKKNFKMHWTCETRVNLVDKELLQHMKRAGCYAIAYGVESASPEILKTIGKDITPEQVEEAVRITHEVGMQTIGYFMVGCPGETRETIMQSIAFAKKLKLDFTQFAVTTPFPGTKLYDLYQKGRKDTDKFSWDDFLYEGTGKKLAPVFETESLKQADLNYWSRRAYKEFYLRPSYIWQRIRSLKSFGDLKVNLNGLAMLLDSIKK